MQRLNTKKEAFEEVTILDKPALFTTKRIDRNSVPRGYHLYEVRHDDDCRGDAIQIAMNVTENHFGSLITRDVIRLTPFGELDIKSKDLNYGTGDCRSMKAFMEKYPSIARPPKSHER